MISKIFKLNIILLFILATISSCSKKSESTTEDINGAIIFNVNGVSEFIEKDASIKENKQEEPNHQISIINSEFEVLTSVGPLEDGTKKSLGKLAVSKLPENITYRIELFKVVGGSEQHIRTLNRTSKTANTMSDSIGVQYNNTYKWYAYSYNDNQAITNTNGSVQIPMGSNKDFLYATGTFNVDFYNNRQIDILFTRKTARIQIEFDGRGVNADAFTALNLTLPTGLVKTANFNLKDNAVVGTPTNVTLPQLTLTSFTNVAGSGDYRKISGVYHTVAPMSITSLSSTGLSFAVRNNFATRTLNSIRTIGTPAAPATFPFTSAIEIGKSTLLKVDLLESGLRYTTSTGFIEFARSNLYRHIATGDHRYRFYPENVQAADPRSYFSFRGHIPLELTERTTPKDPCALVYPAGRWKTATLAEINSSPQPLVGSTGVLGNLLGGLLSLLLTGDHPSYSDVYTNNPQSLASRYIDYNNYTVVNNSQFSVPSNRLAFPLNGEHVVADLANIGSLTVASLNLGTTYNSTVTFWTRESTVDTPLLGVGLGGWSYLGGITEVDLGILGLVNRSYAFGTPSLLAELNLLGLNIVSSNYKNIRCTRNTGWNPASTQAQREPVY